MRIYCVLGMNLVYCMAGLYQRFRDAGYATPKFLLPWRGKTALEHVIGEMVLSAGGAGVFEWVVLVANERDRGSASEVHAVLERLGLAQRGIGVHVEWVQDTRGQAETALLGVEALGRAAGAQVLTRPVLFHNIDTIVAGRDYRAIAAEFEHGADGYIDCIDSDQPQYSYVETSPGEPGVAVDIREKVVISRNATTGLYGFRSGNDYREWSSPAGGVDFAKEFYISDVYRAMLRAGRRVVINTTHKGHGTVIVGTPTEYESLATQREVEAARHGGRVAGSGVVA